MGKNHISFRVSQASERELIKCGPSRGHWEALGTMVRGRLWHERATFGLDKRQPAGVGRACLWLGASAQGHACSFPGARPRQLFAEMGTAVRELRRSRKSTPSEVFTGCRVPSRSRSSWGCRSEDRTWSGWLVAGCDWAGTHAVRHRHLVPPGRVSGWLSGLRCQTQALLPVLGPFPVLWFCHSVTAWSGVPVRSRSVHLQNRCLVRTADCGLEQKRPPWGESEVRGFTGPMVSPLESHTLVGTGSKYFHLR